MTKPDTGGRGEGLSGHELRCLESANSTFGHRTFDDYQVFKTLQIKGFVYETVRAFYTTDAGRAALQAQGDDGGPAFPIPDERDPVTGEGIIQGSSGMSLRDWFAGQAVVACIQKCVPQECDTGENMEQMFARKAFLVADAMLAARAAAKTGGGQ